MRQKLNSLLLPIRIFDSSRNLCKVAENTINRLSQIYYFLFLVEDRLHHVIYIRYGNQQLDMIKFFIQDDLERAQVAFDAVKKAYSLLESEETRLAIKCCFCSKIAANIKKKKYCSKKI
jgi:hypothetical protein